MKMLLWNAIVVYAMPGAGLLTGSLVHHASLQLAIC